MVFTTEFWIERKEEISKKIKNNHWCKKSNRKDISKKISKQLKGKHNSQKTEFKKGMIPWNKGLTKESNESVKKISNTRKKLMKERKIIVNCGFKKGHPQFNTGRTHFKKGEKLGELHPNWNGGSSFEPYSVDWKLTLKKSIRERDNFTCQLCGKKQKKRNFDVHHIDYDKKNCNCDNLITLCMQCHRKTNHNRKKWIKFFKRDCPLMRWGT